MAYTYTQALDALTQKLPALAEDRYSALACNFATNMIWDAADWNESLVALPPFYLQPGEQDHGPPIPIVPTDYQGLRRVQLQRPDGTVVIPDIHPTANLQETTVPGPPQSISYEASKNAFRVYPRVPQGYGAPEYIITGTYKKLPTQITNSTLATAIPFKDKYFPLWIEAIRYAFFVLTADQRAGRISFQNGFSQADGQLAVVRQMIRDVSFNEGLNKGEHNIFPERALAPGRRW